MAEFDQLAEHYDETRGGERRGEEYAAALSEFLPVGEDPILEIGVGTGVVALGLARRGRQVVGIDVSTPMLVRAKQRLGPVVVQSDATKMAIATASVAHAVSVWVVHAVEHREQLFKEVARVLRPEGSYIVCNAQNPAPGDVIGELIGAMSEQIDRRRGAARPRGVTTEEVLAWAASAGFRGSVFELHREWVARPSDELVAIEKRSWLAMRQLDEKTVEEVTRPFIEALRALPDEPVVRRATSDMLVLRQP